MGAKLAKFSHVFAGAPLQPIPIVPVDQNSTQISCPAKAAEILRKEAKDELGIDTRLLNFAFVGGTGVGKSSLINAISGRKSKDPNSAPVGINECTMEIKQYKDPRFAHIIYWDLPGGGTIAHPEDDYWKAKKLYAFDHLLIVGAARFRDFDITIAKTAIANKVPVFFVRSKLDIDIDNECENGDESDEEIEQSKDVLEQKIKLKAEVLQCMKSELEKQNIKNPSIYLVNKKSFDLINSKGQYVKQKNGIKYSLDESQLIEDVLTVANERRYGPHLWGVPVGS